MSHRSNSAQDGPDQASTVPGAYSLAEILSQPQCWNTCLRELRESRTLQEVRARFGSSQDWLFIGCGSSYYIALCAAATMTSLTGRAARAIPPSEILLYPELALADGKRVPVLISRSGQTSEVLKATELLKARGIRTLAISCAAGQALEKLATLTITIPADERSTVMTRSFTSMLLALQYLGGYLAKNDAFCESLVKMPDLAAPALKSLPDRIREFVGQHEFTDYVCLGHGPFFGLACEYALKTMEMSVSYAQSFHSLEFRHGPKSIVSPETLLTFLLPGQGYQPECDLLEEVKSLGATTLVVTNRADQRARAAADLLVELAIDAPELARLPPSLVPGQLLGLYTGLKKGLNPDSPRNLTRAVILDEEDSPRPEHAAL